MESFIKYKKNKIQKKNIKKKNLRKSTPDEIFFIFNKTLEGWKTIKIFNVLIQTFNNSSLNKNDVDDIHPGNVKIYENEIDHNKYLEYIELRKKVYQYHIDQKIIKKENI